MINKPSPNTKWFVHDRFGMFIHWGIYAIPARGEWVRNRESLSAEAYQPYFDEFNPRLYDARAWARLAKRAGQRYAVLTAKHHDGFCLFDSKLTEYKSTNTPARRDLIREFTDAFRAEGIKVGFYYSLLDWHHPQYPVAGDRHHPMRSDATFAKEKRDLSHYVDYLHGQVRELMTNYGKIDVVWFDFSYDTMAGAAWRAKELVDMVHSLQPHIITDNRLSSDNEKYGDFFSPEQIIPAEGVLDKDGKPCVWEACITLNDHWGYCRDDRNFKSPAQIIRMMVECVSKGGNLLLNVGPNALGVIQTEAAERLETVGRWLSVNGESIYGCGRADLSRPEWGYYTINGKVLFAHILHKPVGPIALIGLGGKVRKARLLMDGSEVSIARPWNVEKETKDCFMTIASAALPDELDTVVALQLE
jgi:alpha-L-fucosidase